MHLKSRYGERAESQMDSMPQPIDFWFEFASTYSYPAAMRMDRLARAKGVAIRCSTAKSVGSRPPRRLTEKMCGSYPARRAASAWARISAVAAGGLKGIPTAQKQNRSHARM